MITAADALTDLLGCVRAEFTEDTDPGMRVLAQPGAAFTEDWCGPDACSMAYVRVDGLGVSTEQFPAVDGTPSGRTGPLATAFHVGIARCVATLDDAGGPPDPDVQTEEAIQFLDDAQRLRKAINCCLTAYPTPTRKTVLLGRWTPTSSGACAGGYWPVTLRTH